jgi:hypothetical protein
MYIYKTIYFLFYFDVTSKMEEVTAIFIITKNTQHAIFFTQISNKLVV